MPEVYPDPLPTGAATETTLATVLKEGTDITGASMPAGGASGRGWLSAIWKAITDRLPSALVSGRLDVNVGNTAAISAASLPLPTGAATAAKQPALGTAGSASADVITVQGIASGTAQPISASSLPLPAGASTAAKQPALGTAGSASADVLSIQGVASMTPVKVDGSGVTQPVSGTVTANAGTNLNTSALALDATLTGGTQKSILRGGAKGTTTAADVTSTASGANHQPADVALYDASGNQIGTSGNPVRTDPTGTTNQPVTQAVANWSQNLTQIGGAAPSATNPMPVRYTDGSAFFDPRVSGKTLKTVAVSVTATGTVIAAVASKRLKVYAVKLVCSAALSINFRDGASTLLEGAMPIAANGGFTESVPPPSFLFATTAGNTLDIVVSGTGTVAGRISYFDDDAT